MVRQTQAWGSGYQQQAPAGRGSSGGSGRGGWGSGFRGSQPQAQQPGRGRGGRGNRFDALSEQEDNDRAFANYRGGARSGGGGRDRGRGGGGQQVSWREAVQHDEQNEMPPWPLTCYSHEREADNDLAGDTSFEELRWQQLQAVRSGATPAQLQQSFTAAKHARDQQWQALLRAERPPSLGGPPIQTPASAEPFQSAGPFQQSAGPFQQSAAPFGQSSGPIQQPAGAFQSGGGGNPFQQAAARGSTPFGQAAQSSGGTFGQAASPFGQVAGSSGGTVAIFGRLGASDGGAAASFGQQPQPKTGFGQPAGSFGFGTAASGTSTSASPFGGGHGGGFGAAASPAVASPFGQKPAAAAFGASGGSPFGASGASGASLFGAQPTAQQQQQLAAPRTAHAFASPLGFAATEQRPIASQSGGASAASDSELAIWQSPEFEKGKIPEQAPPAVACQ